MFKRMTFSATMRTLLLAAAATLAVGMFADVATSTSDVAPDASLTIDAARLASPARPVIGGTISCTKGAHYHLNAWIAEHERGSLAKGSIPAKMGSRPSKLALSRARAATLCTGADQSWSLTLKSVGKRPSAFGAGAAETCLVAYVGKGGLYTLVESCKQITVR